MTGILSRSVKAAPLALLAVLLATVAEGAPEATDSLERAPLAFAPPSVPAYPGFPSALVAGIPARPADARSGSAFIESVRGLAPAERERAILHELLTGNIPPFLRSLKKIELAGRDAQGAAGRVEVWVMPDYLAIGSDEDFVRFPANFDTAAAVAQRFGFALPTTAIVDAIYDQAELRLEPQTMTPGPSMTSTAYFELHDARIRAQMNGHAPGELAAGHKKDYVLTNRLRYSPSQEAIYGWHRASDRPIQPLSLVHGAHYADYSHGVRLVAETIFVDGRAQSFYDTLGQERPASLLSKEGAITDARAVISRHGLAAIAR